ADSAAHEIQIRVEDTGIGIPEEKQQAIFDKFMQADVSTARKYGGTGLGLSITQELVDMMNGSIDLESTEGKGTTFYVHLPVVPTTVNADSSLQRVITSTHNNINRAARILVVDDHPVNLLFMRKVLKK
ncbi:MAG: histidine kinase, partial [Alphaproteobacteria bacterium]|nr:histidine kinase [Alphaproteobacteria bacterium]